MNSGERVAFRGGLLSGLAFLLAAPSFEHNPTTTTTRNNPNRLRLGDPFASLPLLHHLLLESSSHVRVYALQCGAEVRCSTTVGRLCY